MAKQPRRAQFKMGLVASVTPSVLETCKQPPLITELWVQNDEIQLAKREARLEKLQRIPSMEMPSFNHRKRRSSSEANLKEMSDEPNQRESARAATPAAELPSGPVPPAHVRGSVSSVVSATHSAATMMGAPGRGPAGQSVPTLPLPAMPTDQVSTLPVVPAPPLVPVSTFCTIPAPSPPQAPRNHAGTSFDSVLLPQQTVASLCLQRGLPEVTAASARSYQSASMIAAAVAVQQRQPRTARNPNGLSMSERVAALQLGVFAPSRA